MGNAGPGAAVSVSYIVPAHNSHDVIEGSLKELGVRLAGANAEILVVENGSSDGTLELLHRIETDWSHDVELRVLRTARGLGNALRAGIAASRGEVVVLSADDLPFGFDEMDAADGLDLVANPVVIGSKAHPGSVVPRSLLRQVLTVGFLVLRRLVLGMRARDPQGTFVLNGQWARDVCPWLREPGFLLPTELVYLAERGGIRAVEVPVRLRVSHHQHHSRIRLRDPVKMGIGLFTVRRRHRRTPATPNEPTP